MSREDDLLLLLQHSRQCVTCLDSLSFGYGEPGCVNGEKLLARVGGVPERDKWGPGTGPSFHRAKGRTRTKIRAVSGLVNPKEAH
jgi:hypothetical protein